MPTGRIDKNSNIAGLNIQSSISRTAPGQIGQEIILPAAKAGTLTGRTDNDTGVATLAGGHGIASLDVVNVFWATGIRYGMVATVAGNEVTVDGGAGDNLPALSTSVTVSKQVPIDVDFDGDKLQMIVCKSDKRAHADFQDSGDATLLAKELIANESWEWSDDSAVANPLTGNACDEVRASNGDSSANATLQIGVLYDSTI